MPVVSSHRTLSQLTSAIRRVRRGTVLLAVAATLMGSRVRSARAEGVDAYHDLPLAAHVELTTLTSAEAMELAMAADPDLISEYLEELRYEQNPDLLPGSGEPKALVWNQTANWIVAVNEDGEPVYLPPEGFERLKVVTMGSLSERYQHFEGLKEQLPGASLGEKVKNDKTMLVLGNYFDAELRDDLATVLRHELFDVPAAGYEESLKKVNGYFGRDDDEPSFFDRALEEAKDEAEWEVERRLDDRINDAIDIITGNIGGR